MFGQTCTTLRCDSNEPFHRCVRRFYVSALTELPPGRAQLAARCFRMRTADHSLTSTPSPAIRRLVAGGLPKAYHSTDDNLRTPSRHGLKREPMIHVHAIRTGSVQIKRAQRTRRPGGLIRALVDVEWTEWLPIYAWLIDHPEGPIVVDTGETSRTSDPDYFPRWHPYYRTSVRMRVRPDEEIGPQLLEAGLNPADVRTVVLTHFHTDHAGGLHHFPQSEILVDNREYRSARGLLGKIQGYLPHRWPTWFDPAVLRFENRSVGPFRRACAVTEDDRVLVVPTPGHTLHHVSVLVRSDDLTYFLAGDTTYTESALLDRSPDGVSPIRSRTLGTMDAILQYARTVPTIYLPSHDPNSEERLTQMRTLPAREPSVAE